MGVVFANGAVGTLTSSALLTDTTLHLTTGQGSRFPNPAAGDYFVLTLQNGSATEIIHVTARVADALTAVRAQEGTTAVGWAAGTVVDMRVTAGLLESFLQFAAGTALAVTSIDLGADGTLTGGTLNNVNITNANISLSQILAGQIKPADGNTSKSLRIPNGGGNPTLGAPVDGGLTEIFTQSRINANGLMEVACAFPTLFLLDTGAAHSAALRVAAENAIIVRLDGATRTYAPFAGGRHPLDISLASGDLVTLGWTLKGDGDADSIDPDIGSLKAKLASIAASNSVKAWVSFDGPSSAIRGSNNVSGISRIGAGQYVVTLTTPLAGGVGAATASAYEGGGASALTNANQLASAHVTSANSILVNVVDVTNVFIDSAFISVIVCGG